MKNIEQIIMPYVLYMQLNTKIHVYEWKPV